MTLTDINDLKEDLLNSKSSAEIRIKLDECGEDCDDKTADKVLYSISNTVDNGFEIKDYEAFFNGNKILCPKCGNCYPEKILASASEILSCADRLHFGCCECGEQFIIQ